MKQPNQLNHREHDFCVHLAEDLEWWEAAEPVGWKQNTVRTTLYKLMKLHDVEGAGEFEINLLALTTELKDRGYANQIHTLEYDEEGPAVQQAELGMQIPRFYDVLPAHSEATR